MSLPKSEFISKEYEYFEPENEYFLPDGNVIKPEKFGTLFEAKSVAPFSTRNLPIPRSKNPVS